MSLSRDEAAQTLREVNTTERQSADLARYRHSAPFFYWWGFYLFCGYAATALWPWRAGLIWTIGAVVAIAGHIALVRKYGQKRADRRWGIAYIIIYAFAGGTLAIMENHFPLGLEIGSFTPLLAGAIYAMAGLFFGRRILVTGIVVMAATMIGLFLLPLAYFAWWMAVVVGGAMMLTGYWLQKA